jgi:hypothetical protein
MEFSKKMGHPRWGPLKSQTTLGEIYLAAIYMLLFPLGYLSMQSTEKMDYHRMEPTKKPGYLGSNLPYSD